MGKASALIRSRFPLLLLSCSRVAHFPVILTSSVTFRDLYKLPSLLSVYLELL